MNAIDMYAAENVMFFLVEDGEEVSFYIQPLNPNMAVSNNDPNKLFDQTKAKKYIQLNENYYYQFNKALDHFNLRISNEAEHLLSNEAEHLLKNTKKLIGRGVYQNQKYILTDEFQVYLIDGDKKTLINDSTKKLLIINKFLENEIHYNYTFYQGTNKYYIENINSAEFAQRQIYDLNSSLQLYRTNDFESYIDALNIGKKSLKSLKEKTKGNPKLLKEIYSKLIEESLYYDGINELETTILGETNAQNNYNKLVDNISNLLLNNSEHSQIIMNILTDKKMEKYEKYAILQENDINFAYIKYQVASKRGIEISNQWNDPELQNLNSHEKYVMCLFNKDLENVYNYENYINGFKKIYINFSQELMANPDKPLRQVYKETINNLTAATKSERDNLISMLNQIGNYNIPAMEKIYQKYKQLSQCFEPKKEAILKEYINSINSINYSNAMDEYFSSPLGSDAEKIEDILKVESFCAKFNIPKQEMINLIDQINDVENSEDKEKVEQISKAISLLGMEPKYVKTILQTPFVDKIDRVHFQKILGENSLTLEDINCAMYGKVSKKVAETFGYDNFSKSTIKINGKKISREQISDMLRIMYLEQIYDKYSIDINAETIDDPIRDLNQKYKTEEAIREAIRQEGIYKTNKTFQEVKQDCKNSNPGLTDEALDDMTIIKITSDQNVETVMSLLGISFCKTYADYRLKIMEQDKKNINNTKEYAANDLKRVNHEEYDIKNNVYGDIPLEETISKKEYAQNQIKNFFKNAKETSVTTIRNKFAIIGQHLANTQLGQNIRQALQQDKKTIANWREDLNDFTIGYKDPGKKK